MQQTRTTDFSKNPLLKELLINVFNFKELASCGFTPDDKTLSNIYRGILKRNDLVVLFDTERWAHEKVEYEAAQKFPIDVERFNIDK